MDFLSDFFEELLYWFIKVISGIAGLIFIVAPFALALTLTIFFSPWFMFFLLSIAIFWPLAFVILQRNFEDI